MFDDREDIAKKLKQKKVRLTARKAQPLPAPQRVSPRLAESHRSLSSSDMRSLLQAPLPKRKPEKAKASLPADPSLNDLVRFKMG